MKLKILLILALICAIISTSVVGTLSAYTIKSSYSAGIVPDAYKIQKQHDIKQSEEKTETYR